MDRVKKKKIQDKTKSIPSILENFPSKPSNNGNAKIIRYRKSRLKILLFTAIPFNEYNATIPNTNVKSATFDASKVPNPNWGMPSTAEIIAIVVSGKLEITATMKKLTMNSDNFHIFAIREENTVAYSALFTKKNKESPSKRSSSIICIFLV